jgi:hypothetical protein
MLRQYDSTATPFRRGLQLNATGCGFYWVAHSFICFFYWKNYNLAFQTVNCFANSLTNYQRSDFSLPNYQNVLKKPILLNMFIIPLLRVN